MIWVTSDTHFNHDKLIEWGYRQKDFNKEIIKKWNSVVKSEDTIIHCGDVVVGRQSEIKEIISQLNGRKILVRGNHDKGKSVNYWMEIGFAFACDMFVMKYGGINICFSHEPLVVLEGSLNIHGHIHSDYRKEELTIGLTKENINVAMDLHNLMPISLNSLMKEERPKEVPVKE